MSSIKIDKKFVVIMTIFFFLSTLISSLVTIENYSCANIAKAVVCSLVGGSLGLGVMTLIYKQANRRDKQ